MRDNGPTFRMLFGGDPETAADAPGRVNLLGEHTDYHEGFVLPSVLPQRTAVEVRRRTDNRVRAFSAAAGSHVVEYRLGSEAPGQGWLDYLQGVTAALRKRGLTIGGFDARIASTVPVGSGVSSSAALEISLLRALREAFALSLDDVAMARIGQAAETELVGAPVGIMDQMACSLGHDREALFLDTRTLAYQRVPFPAAMAIIVIDSGVPHHHADGEYRVRRQESFEAAALLGVRYLRDLDLDALGLVASLPPVLARRARHIITENQRVIDAVAALRSGDVQGLGELFNASHRSMRDQYETSTPDIDTLATIGQRHRHVYGARLTGGGFGGAVVMLANAEHAHEAAVDISHRYEVATGRTSRVLMPPTNAINNS